ncbi:hypothetical protein NKG94_33800 [Micromonospora sp. M12]
MTGATDGDGGAADEAHQPGETAEEAHHRPSVAAMARDRRVWLILAVVAGLLVCCCSAVIGALVALSSGLLTA